MYHQNQPLPPPWVWSLLPKELNYHHEYLKSRLNVFICVTHICQDFIADNSQCFTTNLVV